VKFLLPNTRTTLLFAPCLCLLSIAFAIRAGAQVATNSSAAPPASATKAPKVVPGKFVDITQQSHIDFLAQASHTDKKYLIETMGSGVALFDYDNDGRLDIFFANGAPLSDPTPRGQFRRRPGRNTGTASTIKSRMAPSRM